MLNIVAKDIPYQKRNIIMNASALNDVTKVVNNLKNLTFDPRSFNVQNLPTGTFISNRSNNHSSTTIPELPFDLSFNNSNSVTNTYTIKVVAGDWLRTVGAGNSIDCKYPATGYGDFGVQNGKYIAQVSNAFLTNTTTTSYIAIQLGKNDYYGDFIPCSTEPTNYIIKVLEQPDIDYLMQDVAGVANAAGGIVKDTVRVIGKVETNTVTEVTTLTQLYHGEIQDQFTMLDSQIDTKLKRILNGHSYTPQATDTTLNTKNAIQDRYAWEYLLDSNSVLQHSGDLGLVMYGTSTNATDKEIYKAYSRLDSCNVGDGTGSTRVGNRSLQAASCSVAQIFGFDGLASYSQESITDLSNSYASDGPQFLLRSRQLDGPGWQVRYGLLGDLKAKESSYSTLANYANSAGSYSGAIRCDQINWSYCATNSYPWSGLYWLTGDTAIDAGSTLRGRMINSNDNNNAIDIGERRLFNKTGALSLDFDLHKLCIGTSVIVEWGLDGADGMLFDKNQENLIGTDEHTFWDINSNYIYKLENSKMYFGNTVSNNTMIIDGIAQLVGTELGWVIDLGKQQLLNESSGAVRVDWEYQTLKSGAFGAEVIQVDWANSHLIDPGTHISIDWVNRYAKYINGVTNSIQWDSSELCDTGGFTTINWNTRTASGDWNFAGNVKSNALTHATANLIDDLGNLIPCQISGGVICSR